jgi:hypothetical protein
MNDDYDLSPEEKEERDLLKEDIDAQLKAGIAEEVIIAELVQDGWPEDIAAQLVEAVKQCKPWHEMVPRNEGSTGFPKEYLATLAGCVFGMGFAIHMFMEGSYIGGTLIMLLCILGFGIAASVFISYFDQQSNIKAVLKDKQEEQYGSDQCQNNIDSDNCVKGDMK